MSRKQKPEQALHTLIVMHLPDFQQGYWSGRNWYFHGEDPETPLTDEDMIDTLKTIASEGAFTDEDESLLHWHVGFMVGLISGRVIPEPRRKNKQRKLS